MTQDEIRALFPGTRELVYFNAAAQALLPSPVVERVEQVARRHAERGIMGYSDDVRELEQARAAAARLVGCDPRSIAFTGNTAEGLSRIAQGVDWREGDEIVLCDLEYPANVYPWAAQQSRGARLRFVRSRDGRVEAERYLERIGPRTRVVAVSHVQFATGYRVDLELLAEACRERGAMLVLDAIQSLGVVPLDLQALGVAAMAVEGRKWLLGPPGCGFLYVAPEWEEAIRPVALGSRSVRDADDLLQYRGWLDDGELLDLDEHLADGAARFEAGYPNLLGIAGLGAALEFAEEIGRERIQAHIAGLVARFVARLEQAGLPIYGPRHPEQRAGIVSFEIPGSPESLFEQLNLEAISLAVREGRVRVAPHIYNTEEEVDAVVERVLMHPGLQ